MSHELADSGTKIGKVKTHNDGTRVLHLNYFDMLEILRRIGYTVENADNAGYVRRGISETSPNTPLPTCRHLPEGMNRCLVG